jgi:putative N-acetyltransferase (TIGR04045 family)
VTDATPWGDPIVPFFSTVVTAQIASEPWHLRGYHALRRAIFVEEQGLFDGSDVDEHDSLATPIVVLGHAAGMPDDVIGVVRIYPTRGGTWYGGRLGVCRTYRTRGIVGSALVFAAVSTAHARGCTRFLATIQEGNVGYFERHGFRTVRSIEVCDRPHRLMEADLAMYPPRVAHALQPVDGAHAVAELRKRRAA